MWKEGISHEGLETLANKAKTASGPSKERSHKAGKPHKHQISTENSFSPLPPNSTLQYKLEKSLCYNLST